MTNSVEISMYPLLGQRGIGCESGTYNIVGETGLTVVKFSARNNQGLEIPERYLVPTDRQIKKVIRHMAGVILESGVNLDGMVTAANGGLVPAKYLQDWLGLPLKVVTLGLKGYGEDNRPLSEMEVIHSFPRNFITKGDGLGIDDIDDSGRSGNKIREMMANVTAGRVYFGAVFRRPKSVCPTDFVGVEVDNNAWIRFPWDDVESERNFRGIWGKKGIDERVQQMRLEVMASDNLEEQRELVGRLNEMSGTAFGSFVIAS